MGYNFSPTYKQGDRTQIWAVPAHVIKERCLLLAFPYPFVLAAANYNAPGRTPGRIDAPSGLTDWQEQRSRLQTFVPAVDVIAGDKSRRRRWPVQRLTASSRSNRRSFSSGVMLSIMDRINSILSQDGNPNGNRPSAEPVSAPKNKGFSWFRSILLTSMGAFCVLSQDALSFCINPCFSDVCGTLSAFSLLCYRNRLIDSFQTPRFDVSMVRFLIWRNGRSNSQDRDGLPLQYDFRLLILGFSRHARLLSRRKTFSIIRKIVVDSHSKSFLIKISIILYTKKWPGMGQKILKIFPKYF